MNKSNESEDILITFLNEHIHKPLESQQNKKLESIKEEIDASISENYDIKETLDKVKGIEDVVKEVKDLISQISLKQEEILKSNEGQKALLRDKTTKLKNLLSQINNQVSKTPQILNGISQTKKDLNSTEVKALKKLDSISGTIDGVIDDLKMLTDVDQNINQLMQLSKNIESKSELIPSINEYLAEIKKDLLNEIKSELQEIIKLDTEQNQQLQKSMTQQISQTNKKLVYLMSAFGIQLIVTVGYIVYLSI